MKVLALFIFYHSLNVDKALRLPQEPKKSTWRIAQADEEAPPEDEGSPTPGDESSDPYPDTSTEA
ncbi:MAG: hypothetical protein KA116_00600 [Proteobacteria bacterium]|nr:hypothetical protein [Pseudomonadota bacterium]